MTVGLTRPASDQPAVVAGTALAALALADAGDTAGARQLLYRVVTDEVVLPRDNFWLGAVALFAGVAAAVGSPRQRAICRSALEPAADQLVVFGAGGAVFGPVSYWLGQLAQADHDEAAAADLLTRAVDICYNADAPFWAERASQELRPAAGSTD